MRLLLVIKNTALCVNYIFIHFQIQDCITSLSCNDKGSLIISGGTDGKVCIWHWGRDEFLHRAGEIYITNLPIQSAKVKVNGIDMFNQFIGNLYLNSLSASVCVCASANSSGAAGWIR